MAVDTRDRRASAAGLLSLPGLLLPHPDGDISWPDRIHVAGLYRGLVLKAFRVESLDVKAFAAGIEEEGSYTASLDTQPVHVAGLTLRIGMTGELE